MVEGSSTKLYTATGDPEDYYYLNIVTGTSNPVCATSSPTVQVFVRDYQNSIMIWNVNWLLDFRNRIQIDITGSKVNNIDH